MSWPDIYVSTGENITIKFTVKDKDGNLVDFTGLTPKLAIIENDAIKNPPGVITGSSPSLGNLEFNIVVPTTVFSALYEVATIDGSSNKNVLTDRDKPKIIARKSYIT